MDAAKLKAELLYDEGLRTVAYKDTSGFWTIGIGHLLGNTQRMVSLTPAEVQALYGIDVAAAEALARQCVPAFDAMADARQRALVNMAFNRGQHLVTSTTILPAILKAVASGLDADWEAVSDAIVDSPWGQQVGGRAARLAYMFKTGTDAT